jgi:DNA-directed RNA polymerase specialized sigma24 family protein
MRRAFHATGEDRPEDVERKLRLLRRMAEAKELTHAEMAAELGWTEATVSQRLSRMRRGLSLVPA